MSLDSQSVRLVPLGGWGEIGMNCLAIEHSDDILVVDCGSSFPFDDLGVDLYHPNFTWLWDRADRVRGAFITHGHEDHIGGLPYLLQKLRTPIWGPPHALGLIERRLHDHGFDTRDLVLTEAHPLTTYRVGSFSVEPIRVSHSIVEATALKLETHAGIIIHTGDFNLDPDPPDGEPTDIARFRAIGDAGVALLLSDSTNVDTGERLGSERSVGQALERLIGEAEHRVFLAMFASNIQRLILLGEIAKRRGRKICLLGRSLTRQVEVATEMGRLQWPSDLCVGPEQAQKLPREQLLVLAGGTQAERNSALRRLAGGTHPLLSVETGDTVILSSRIIPGNERPVHDMMTDLLRKGATLHSWRTDPAVHTSGHAGRSEQSRIIEWLRPRCFIPLHGTLHHLLRHAELARSHGIGQIMVVENGTAVLFNGQELRRDGVVPSGRVAVSAAGRPLPAETLQRRSLLGREGIALVCVTVDKDVKVVSSTRVSAHGVPGLDPDSEELERVAKTVASAAAKWRNGSLSDLEIAVRRAARNSLFELGMGSPIVDVQLLEV
ncbi:MAG TPA: ribonuclease J [Polyangiaceae bacterium]